MDEKTKKFIKKELPAFALFAVFSAAWAYFIYTVVKFDQYAEQHTTGYFYMVGVKTFLLFYGIYIAVRLVKEGIRFAGEEGKKEAEEQMKQQAAEEKK
jgi:Na+/H+ antiporter NhaD/arsenite permease-like protein